MECMTTPDSSPSPLNVSRNREGLSNKQGVWHSIGHANQTSLRRDADASKQVGEPGIGAKGVPERLYFEVSETIEPLLVSLFEPTKGLILVFQSGINQRIEESGYKTVLGSRRKLLNDP